jgi:hypothetical protein
MEKAFMGFIVIRQRSGNRLQTFASAVFLVVAGTMERGIRSLSERVGNPFTTLCGDCISL